MAPRPYRLGQRQAATEQTRSRIIEAARELFKSGEAFSIDAVARKAGVARMTVYYQFGSKAGLLDALFDELAQRGLVAHLPAVFARQEPYEALHALISAFVNFWHSDRLVIRRIHGAAALDPEVGQANEAREERRRVLLRAVLARIAERYGAPASDALDEVIDVLFTLTSFETYDRLAGRSRGREEVARILYRVSRASLDTAAGDKTKKHARAPAGEPAGGARGGVP